MSWDWSSVVCRVVWGEFVCGGNPYAANKYVSIDWICAVPVKAYAHKQCLLPHQNLCLRCSWYAAEVIKCVFGGVWCNFEPFVFCLSWLWIISYSDDMPYIAKGTLYTQYVIKIKFALIHGIELLAFDFIYYPWGESVGDEFVWNSCIRFHPKRRYFGKISVKKNLQTFLVMRSM